LGLAAGTATLWAGAGAAASSNRAKDLAFAKKHLLRLSDLPSGWKAENNVTTGKGGSFPGAKQLARCLHVPTKLVVSTAPEANSPYFQNKDGSLEVQGSISVFASAQSANAQYAAISDAKTPRCMTTLANTSSFKSKILGSAGQGTKVGHISVTSADGGVVGSNAAGFTMRIPINAQGASVTALLTEIFFINGKFGEQISFNAYDKVFPSSLAKRLVSTAKKRL
jgi:hypothetical protein